MTDLERNVIIQMIVRHAKIIGITNANDIHDYVHFVLENVYYIEFEYQ